MSSSARSPLSRAHAGHREKLSRACASRPDTHKSPSTTTTAQAAWEEHVEVTLHNEELLTQTPRLNLELLRRRALQRCSVGESLAATSRLH